MKELGWRAAYGRFLLEEDEEEEGRSGSNPLPPLRQGDSVEVLSARVSTGKTAPPKRYTEATLLTAMEHPPTQGMDRAQGKILEETGGSGTPATRADIIEKLFSAFYIERRGRSRSPPPRGVRWWSWRRRTSARPASPPGGRSGWGHRAGLERGERLCKRNARVCIPAGGRGEDKRRRLPPRQRNPGEVPGLRQVPSGRPGQAGERCWCVRTGSAATGGGHLDHQCPLPQLPQKDGASGRRGSSSSPVCAVIGTASDFKKRHAHSAAGKRTYSDSYRISGRRRGPPPWRSSSKSGWSSRKMKMGDRRAGLPILSLAVAEECLHQHTAGFVLR